jgi:hypothetical protein
MVRPRVARGIRRSGVSGLASMYPVSDWSSLCSGPLWISARMRSHYRTGLNGPFGSPVFACAGKTDPPSLLILSQTSAGKGFGVITSSLVLSMPLAIRRAQGWLRLPLGIHRTRNHDCASYTAARSSGHRLNCPAPARTERHAGRKQPTKPLKARSAK